MWCDSERYVVERVKVFVLWCDNTLSCAEMHLSDGFGTVAQARARHD